MLATLLGRPSIRGFELRQGIESLVDQVCRSAKVTPPLVVWDRSISTAAVTQSGHKMYLACPADDAVITRKVFTRYVGYVLHEVLHLIYSNNFTPSNHAYLHALWNAIEDAWIEHKGIQARMTGNIEAVLRELVRQITQEALDHVTDWADPCQYPFALAIYLRQHAPLKVPLADGLAPIFDEARRRMAASTSSQVNMTIAVWVLEQLQQIKPPQQPPQQPQDEANEQAKDEADQQPGQDGDEGDKGDDGDQQQGGDGEGDGGPASPGPAKAPAMNNPATEVEPSLGEIQTPGTSGQYCKTKAVSPPSHHLRDVCGMGITPVQGRLRNEVRRMFDNTGSTAFQRNRKAGAINTAALHRVGTTERLFQRRQDIDGVDSAVVILLDVSGSMSGGRIQMAASACAAIHEALTLAGCAVSVMSFHTTVAQVIPFGVNPVRAKTILPRVRLGGGTNDFQALMYAHEVLMHRPEERRVCMVLTDAGGQQDSVRHQIKSAEALGISTIGIGIQSRVGHVYSSSVDVFHLQELGTAALSQLKLAA